MISYNSSEWFTMHIMFCQGKSFLIDFKVVYDKRKCYNVEKVVISSESMFLARFQ